jgi:peptidoglycan-associated lipoprotein
VTLTASPETINAGQSSTLAWQATNATTVTITPDIGAVAVNGNRQVTPMASITYEATAVGPGGKASQPRRITVNIPPAPPPPKVNPLPAPTVTVIPLADQFDRAIASQPILFDYDRSDIRSDQIPKLQNHASWLKQNAGVRITVEGHADERGSQEYNIGLGDERAASVMKYLAGQGVAANRMTTVSYGEERPTCRTTDEKCYQDNRRAAFVMAK